ncbi:MAG: hypothetical protein A2521_14790 [Deltaproteobacteria bacterium RIFOXYD12_FULL_57_12]|nr:MAG: hypothetical protein A2521_14790 [Deltaproteobacteria bacterium RIFOXYD12_FULL_57_12]
MLIKDWMAKNVLTVDENTSVMRATRIMKENRVRRLPVLSHGKLVGIITDRDLKDASPSKTNSLDIHEMYYLLSEMKVKEVMTRDPICMTDDESLEKAAVVMLENKISGILVTDEAGHLCGLVSETDVILAFLHSAGVKDGTYQYIFNVPDTAGSVTKVVAAIREHKARIISILTSFADTLEGWKQVSVRIDVDDKSHASLHKDLADNFEIVFHGRDELNNLPKKKN